MVPISIRQIIFGKTSVVLCAVLLIVAGTVFLPARLSKNIEPISRPKSDTVSEIRAIGSLYTDRTFFLSAIKQSKITDTPQNVTGLIVPHHLLAIDLIAGAFAGISANEYQTIVVLSPDHFSAGRSNISVTERNLNTVFGDIVTDKALVQKLKKLPFVNEGNFLYREHGQQAILPFVKYYFPETKVVTITFKPTTSKTELDQLIDILKIELPADSLIVQSTDFSHYLTPDQASVFDDVSIKAINSDNTDEILLLKQPEHLDSVAAMYVQARLQTDLFQTVPIIQEHKNSQAYTTDKVVSSTSYITALYSKSRPEQGKAEFMFVGDIMLSRYIGQIMERSNNYDFPYEKMKSFFSSADLVFGNLESPISNKGKSVGSLYSFRADPKSVVGLKNAGFTVVSVANNHAFDYGVEAFTDTLTNLKSVGIAYAGGGENFTQASGGARLNIHGIQVTVLAFTDLLSRKWGATNEQAGVSYLDKQEMINSIAAAKKTSDLVIVSFHWGREYETQSNGRQKEFAQAAVEAGASLIVGHHPHVAQEMSKINNVVVAYSLGNFIFDQNFSKETNTGLLLKVEIKDKKIERVSPYTVYFNKDFQPYVRDKD
ncbi:MAG TPA: AmmeMemoRadiSam system protein B [bacterium]|nr:AmmeMemoRadiSam system protein B [bacterium]